MMQWVIAAIRPLVLTMGPLVLTMVFCGLGMFTSCSKDDNPESETEYPDVGAAASNYNINDADFTPTTWRQQEAIYIWDGTTKITDKNRKNPESYALVNLPWYEGEKQTNLPNGFCDDITPENGWEWVFNYCGRTNIPNNNFFGVYNKYFGILRVFFYMPSGVQTGNDHLWQISMTNNLANHYLWGYGLPYTQTPKNRSLLSRTGDGTQIEYVAPWVEIDPSSIEVELNPNVFPEDEIEWIQVNATAYASRRMGMTGTDRFRTAYGLQPRYRGESETGIKTKVYGARFSSIYSFDMMCNQYGDELNPFFDYMHASEDKGEMNFPALVIHEVPSDGKEQFIYGRGYQDIYALEPALLTYNGPYYGNEETNPASIFLPALEVNVTVSVKMKGKDNTFVFSRNYLPEIKDITLGDTYDIFKDIQNHQLNPKQAGHRAGYDYQVGRLRIYLQSLGIEFPD